MRELTHEDWERLGERQWPSVRIFADGLEVLRCGINHPYVDKLLGRKRDCDGRSIVIAEAFEGGHLFVGLGGRLM